VSTAARNGHAADGKVVMERATTHRTPAQLLGQLIERRSLREPFRRTLTANVAANVIRNLWA
jgi:hypothetical protein